MAKKRAKKVQAKTPKAKTPAKRALKAGGRSGKVSTQKVATKKVATKKGAAKKGTKVAKSNAKSNAKSSAKSNAKSSAKAAPKAERSKKVAVNKAKLSRKPSKENARSPLTTRVVSMAQARDHKTKVGSISKMFTPLDDRILVERDGVADRTPGGLYIPDTATSVDRPTRGKVVAVGRGHLDKKGRVKPLDVRLGDTVMFAPYSGSEIKIEGLDLLVIRESEIIAIVDRG